MANVLLDSTPKTDVMKTSPHLYPRAAVGAIVGDGESCAMTHWHASDDKNSGTPLNRRISDINFANPIHETI